MKEIALSGGYVTVVDDEEFERFNRYKWSATVAFNKHTVYAYRKEAGAKSKNVLLHREILGAPKGAVVDHIDGDGLNNRRSNIRVTTISGNSMNKRKLTRKRKASFRGVQIDASGRYFGCVVVGRKRHYTPHTTDEIQAAKDRDALAAMLHGDHAIFNFPEGVSLVTGNENFAD